MSYLRCEPTEPRPSAAIAVEDVTLRFGEGPGAVEALHDVSLRIEEGEFVSIVGASGCGKTSLLRLMAGLAEPTAGRVSIGGEVVTTPPSRVGMVFQRPVLLEWRRVIDNVLLPLEVAGTKTSASRDEAMALLDMLGLRRFANSFPGQLSGGMQQRASIARTLITKPEVLLMDEPFGALDAITREQLNLELLELWSRQRSTCVFVTHDIDEAVLLSDRVVLMSPRPGQVQRELRVDLPRPRDLDVRYTEPFAELSRSIHHDMLATISGGSR
jgi:NitT/TauT family transport system ATP-binding protein